MLANSKFPVIPAGPDQLQVSTNVEAEPSRVIGLVSHVVASVPASAIDWRSNVMVVSKEENGTPQEFVTVSITVALPSAIPRAEGVKVAKVGSTLFWVPPA